MSHSKIGAATLWLHFASIAVVRTLHLRNVPDEVAERLERLARREGMSLNALSVRELARIARRVDNPELLEGLPDLDIRAEEVVADVERGRPGE